MPTIIEHFDMLTECGLKIIPVRENSKAPLTKEWQKSWTWAESRERLGRFPDANIGLLLGDIIDVEGDSEHANKVLIDLIGDYPHPHYRSTKSIHHLFLSPDPELRILRFNNIEFRGFGHQSLLPPSKCLGTEYDWLSNKFPVPEMPDRLRRFYESRKGGSKEPALKPGCLKTWCATCREERRLHQKRFNLELQAFKLLGSPWECQQCRTLDLRPIVRGLRG